MDGFLTRNVVTTWSNESMKYLKSVTGCALISLVKTAHARWFETAATGVVMCWSNL